MGTQRARRAGLGKPAGERAPEEGCGDGGAQEPGGGWPAPSRSASPASSAPAAHAGRLRDAPHGSASSAGCAIAHLGWKTTSSRGELPVVQPLAELHDVVHLLPLALRFLRDPTEKGWRRAAAAREDNRRAHRGRRVPPRGRRVPPRARAEGAPPGRPDRHGRPAAGAEGWRGCPRPPRRGAPATGQAPGRPPCPSLPRPGRGASAAPCGAPEPPRGSS